ncbi:MAG: DNA circularization N-terminal domain-containing protein [Baekduiaceae bacterium]
MTFGEAILESSFGGLRIDVLSVDDDFGQDVVAHPYANVDGADTEDMGARQRTTNAQLIFFPLAPDDDWVERFIQFMEMKKDRQPHDFVHPILGTYSARVTECRAQTSADEGAIVVSATFVEHSTPQAIFAATPGAPSLSAMADLEASAQDLDDALAAAGATSDIPAAARTTAQGWVDLDPDSLSARDVTLELVDLSNQIDREMNRLEVATNIRRYPICRAMVHLNNNLRRVAQAVTSTTPRFIDITVSAPVPLLILAARVYGAAKASLRASQIKRLNIIPNASRIEGGTVLKAPSAVSPRDRLRSPR